MKNLSLVATAVVACGTAVLATTAIAAPPDHAGGGPSAISECQVIDESGSYILAANLPGGGGYLEAGAPAGAVEGDCILITGHLEK